MAARFAFIALALVLLHLGTEAWLHRRRLRRIPLRIHVNGTRGKTSVTRLLAATLRQAGIRTLAKVTGDEPRLILPDGTEQKIDRRGPARIQEQIWFIRQAVAWQAEAVVVECMALTPELQQVTEERMLRATIGVITNVRPDHFEVMGEDLEAVAAALGRTIPQQGVLITAERRYFPALAAGAAARGTRAILAEAPAGASGNASPPHEHQAIVRTVCAELKLVPPALEPGRAWTPEVWRLDGPDRRVFLLNAFSANDPVSTALLQESARNSVALPRPWVALLNNRADRPRRMEGFLDFLQEDSSCEVVALGGIVAEAGGLDGTGLEAGRAAIDRAGVRYLDEGKGDTLERDVIRRLDLYREACGGRPAAFVNVGGAMTSLGAVREAPLFPAGLITATDRSVDPQRGLIARMAEQGVPVIHLLDIRHLAGKYGLPIDPVPLPPGPAGTVMKPGRYARAGAGGGLLALALILAWTDRQIRKSARVATAAQPVRT